MGIIVQELLQGFGGPKAAEDLLSRLASLPWLEPARADYIGAADLRNQCRRRGVQLGTVDALIAQVCLHHELTLLTFDRDFVHASSFVPLQVWAA
jgi:predicted nucleic acid-binding protein